MLAFLLSSIPVDAQQRVDTSSRVDDLIIMDLTSSDYEVMARGLDDYLSIPNDQRSPQLRKALVQALVVENRRMEKLIGSPSSHIDEGTHDVPLVLLEAVLELQDPNTIPVLLPWMCCGLDDELIDFGKQSFTPAINFVLNNGPKVRASSESFLWTLRMMVDYWGIESFSSTERKQLKEIALNYLSDYSGIYDWLVLTNAIALSLSINDPELINIVKSINNSDDEIKRRKITSEYGVKIIKKTASEGLAGTLELRQYAPAKQRSDKRMLLDTIP